MPGQAKVWYPLHFKSHFSAAHQYAIVNTIMHIFIDIIQFHWLQILATHWPRSPYSDICSFMAHFASKDLPGAIVLESYTFATFCINSDARSDQHALMIPNSCCMVHLACTPNRRNHHTFWLLFNHHTIDCINKETQLYKNTAKMSTNSFNLNIIKLQTSLCFGHIQTLLYWTGRD